MVQNVNKIENMTRANLNTKREDKAQNPRIFFIKNHFTPPPREWTFNHVFKKLNLNLI